jgi:hypothetical protein
MTGIFAHTPHYFLEFRYFGGCLNASVRCSQIDSAFLFRLALAAASPSRLLPPSPSRSNWSAGIPTAESMLYLNSNSGTPLVVPAF